MSKFQIISSKKSGPIVQSDQKILSSRVEPEKEAHRWVAQQSFDSSIDALVVLGAGSGYHLKALRDKFPSFQIFCLDPFRELQEIVTKIHGFSDAEVDFICVESLNDLVSHARFRKIVESHFQILIHHPSVRLKPESYSEINNFLLGRDPESYEVQANIFWANSDSDFRVHSEEALQCLIK